MRTYSFVVFIYIKLEHPHSLDCNKIFHLKIKMAATTHNRKLILNRKEVKLIVENYQRGVGNYN